MKQIEFYVAGLPAAQPRQRHSLVKTKTGRQFIHNYVPGDNPIHGWKESIGWQAKEHRPPMPLTGPVLMHLRLWFPRLKAHLTSKGVKPTAPRWKDTKPDFDNLAKGVADVLTNMGFWQDDGQIAVTIIEKRYGDTPGMNVRIKQLI